MSPFEASIRALISSYLDGTISSAALTDQLPDPWELHDADDPVATELAMRVMAALADFHAGDLAEVGLRERLAVLSRRVRVSYGLIPFATRTASTTVVAPSSFGLAAVGRRGVTESVS